MGNEWRVDFEGLVYRLSGDEDKDGELWRKYKMMEEWSGLDAEEKEVEQISTRAFNTMKRIAAEAMRELERNDLSDFVVLKDAELGKWWNAFKKQEAEEIEMARIKEEKRIATKTARDTRLAKEAEDARVKAELLSRLTPDEKRILGIK